MISLIVMCAVAALFAPAIYVGTQLRALRARVTRHEQRLAILSERLGTAMPKQTAAEENPADRPVVAIPEPPTRPRTAPPPPPKPLEHPAPPPPMAPPPVPPPPTGSPEPAAKQRPDINSTPATAALSLEERIGSLWLRNVGLGLLAIGIAYFVNLVHPRLTPGGTTAIAYAFALGVFAVGKWQEKSLERFARPVMIGGLTLAYFVSFAAHFIEPTRCVSLPVAVTWMTLGLVPLFILADRWRSQAAAGLTVFLGHVSIFVATTHADAWPLVAIAFLACLAAALHVRNSWPPFSLLALVGSYASHLLWVLFGRTAAGAHLAPSELWLSIGFLSSYYFIFAAAELAWRRRGTARDTGTSIDQVSGRAIGPTNVVLYAALVSFLYTRTPDATAIHWFFFAFAIVQAVLARVHRHVANPDADLYPPLAIVFATIGACAYFDALALSEVLAMEALVLLLAAHRTRLWVFHLLAQAALALNFLHYWLIRPPTEASLPIFLGGLLIALVYLVKASLEDLWYRPGALQEWSGGAASGPLLRPLACGFDAVYVRVAPHLATAHAIGGALILVHEIMAFCAPNPGLLVLATVLVLSPVVAYLRASRVLLPAHVVVQGAVALAGIAPLAEALLWQHRTRVVIDPWTGWATAAAGWIALLGFVSTMRATQRRTPDVTGLALGAATLALFTLCPTLPTGHVVLYLAWILIAVLVFVAGDRILSLPAHTGREFLAGVRLTTQVATLAVAGPLLWTLTHRHTAGAGMENMLWLRLWCVGLLAAGIARRSVVLLAAGAAALAGHLWLLDLGLTTHFAAPELVLELRWWMPALDWTIAIALLWAASRRLGSRDAGAAAWVSQAIVAIALGSAITVATGRSPHAIGQLLPWVIALGVGFASQERVAWTRGGAAPDVIALSVALGLVLWTYVGTAIALPVDQALGLVATGIALCTIGALRRHAGLYVAGTVLVLATYAELYIIRPLPGAVSLGSATTLLIVGLTLGLAVVQDGFLARVHLREALRPLALPSATVLYVLGLLLWSTYIDQRIGDPWADPLRAGLALVLLVAASHIRGRAGGGVSLAYLLLTGVYLIERIARSSSTHDALWPALTLVAEAIAFERCLRVRPLLPSGSGTVDKYARPLVVGLAVTIGMVAIRQSPVFGVDHQYVTIGWSLLAGLVMALGFGFHAGLYRRTALAALALCLLRVFVVDTQRLGDFTKPATFVLLAACLLIAAWCYSRYATRLRQWL